MEEHKITPEHIAEMKAKAQLMQDELYSEGQESLSSTGTLSTERLCDKAAEYENYMLTIRMLEERLENASDDE